MDDRTAMLAAIEEAEQALNEGEMPVGCVIVKDGEIIARGHNLREQTGDPTAHAEIEAIRELSLKIEAAAAHGQNPVKIEQDFHNTIALASHNQFMTKLMPIINKSIYTDLTYFEESITYSLQDHREIVRFIESGNGEGARSAMRLHILHAYQISNLEFE